MCDSRPLCVTCQRPVGTNDVSTCIECGSLYHFGCCGTWGLDSHERVCNGCSSKRSDVASELGTIKPLDERKPVSVSTVWSGKALVTTIVCNDGTMWHLTGGTNAEWRQLPCVPQSVRHEQDPRSAKADAVQNASVTPNDPWAAQQELCGSCGAPTERCTCNSARSFS